MVNLTVFRLPSIVVSLLILFTSATCRATELFISTTGNDKNPGTIENPLATIEAARDKIRSIHQPITVYLRGGTYYLNRPIVFSQADSRKSGEKVTYKSYRKEHVVISGAAILSPQWQVFKGNIVTARVPAGLVFDQLFVNGRKLRMARYPNYDSTASHFGGYAADVMSLERSRRWTHPEGAFIHALHKNEWGGYHYRVTGKNTDGLLKFEGGYQNNRQMGMHDKYRFIENVFEELDTTGEWYFNEKEKALYLYKEPGQDVRKITVTTPQIKHLIEFRGTAESPVRNIAIEGLELTHTLRTFMDTKEPLLRSDWAIYRGGAVVLEGTEDCSIRKCYFNAVGGNAVFLSNYNRRSEVVGCHIANAGANGVCLVGDPNAVRSPSFEYHQAVPYDMLDLQPGPKTNNYPAECRVSDNLMYGLGQVEKQVAGIEISMAMDILASHNTIYNVPRSGINISEGTWGGHIIEYNDVFNTVLETGDHGSFNSWGRDRFWYPNREKMNQLTAKHPQLPLLDAVKTVIIRNNRFRCDHGWDIDLDDGSTNYHIYNNLCLNGGLKLREGFGRKVENNIIVNNSFHPHVWFASSRDIFRKNIVMKPYYPIQIKEWGQEVDYNFFPDSIALNAAKKNNTDMHSTFGNPQFKHPASGDYSVLPSSEALKIGFVNFPMNEFGVISPELKAIAVKPPLPFLNTSYGSSKISEAIWLESKIRNITGPGDRSAYGLPDETGVLIETIAGRVLTKSELKKGDVIRALGKRNVGNITELMDLYQAVNWQGHAEIEIIRNQQTMKFDLSFK
jgi:hypothetical protein